MSVTGQLPFARAALCVGGMQPSDELSVVASAQSRCPIHCAVCSHGDSTRNFSLHSI